jgi:CRP-like cAMP-binding protein
MTECTLLKIEQEAFYDLVATNTDVLKGIMRTLCRRLREQDRITVEMIKTRDKKTIPET